MTYLERAHELRAATDIHYNCCQSVLIPFAAEMGMTEEQALALGSHFRGGMLHGSTCGAVTGALMVLGSLGYGEQEARNILRQVREAHGATDCATLLRTSHERGEVRKDHCDGLVFEMVEALTKIREAG